MIKMKNNIKKCKLCGLEKDNYDFYSDKIRIDGLSRICKCVQSMADGFGSC
jgi:hypothetical protein